MKKVWLLFVLTVIIAAQLTFTSAFHSASEHCYVSGTSGVFVSKLNYASMRATIYISLSYKSAPVLLIFPNGTQIEITDNYTLDLFLPRSGDVLGSYSTGTALGISPASGDYQMLSLSHNHPIDVDVVTLPSSFLPWLDDGIFPEYFENIDVYWFKIQGEANIHIDGYGMAI
ncbi:MAG: hypothetical protein NWF06_06975 [Candidatus Bathyarchaeota archaeon]|nr:hypothetical protein [Candidatus Bathyarchaeum sp.]